MRGLALMPFIFHRYTLIFCRLFAGAVFMIAAWGKLEDPIKFMGAVANYNILPDWALPWVGAGMPGVEMICGLALVAGVKVRANGLIVTGLMILFIGVLISAILRGLELDCSCFDMLNKLNVFAKNDPNAVTMVGWPTVWRDLVLLVPCIPLCFYPDRKLV